MLMREDLVRRIKTLTLRTVMMQGLKTCRVTLPPHALTTQALTTLVRLRPWQ